MPCCFSLQKKVNCAQTITAINFNKGITGKEKIKVYLDKLDVFKLSELNEIHPRILAKLPQKTSGLVVITSEQCMHLREQEAASRDSCPSRASDDNPRQLQSWKPK